MHQVANAKTLHEAVQEYVSARLSANIPVSTGRARKAIREACPNAEHTDGEILEVIAASAVRAGCAVFFDADDHLSS
jgi:hypothetical protein